MIEFTIWHWLAFGAFVVTVLVLDLAVFHRHSRETTVREAALWTFIWCSMALAFNGLIYLYAGPHLAIEFLTGYLIEWTLSMDNVFVFAVVFAFFGVPAKHQYRLLFWGILGAIVMRLSFVLAGAELIERFHWSMVILGAFLIYTGIKLALHGDAEMHPDQNPLLRLARRWFPVAKQDHGERFFAVENGRWCLTPLFLVLLVIETTDVMFAFDSVPAIFAVTKNTFVVFSSNIFAILGLRALYFLLAGVMDLFRFLKYGLSAILVFVGAKMLAEWYHDDADGHLIPPLASLAVVVSLLAISILASIIVQRLDRRAGPDEPIVNEPTELASGADRESIAPGDGEPEAAAGDVPQPAPHANRRAPLKSDSQARAR